jgi:lysophospholipase L1-like esterase
MGTKQMKKLILSLIILAGVVSGVDGAKYTFIGDSRMAMDTAVANEMVRTLNDGSTVVNRAVSGYGWQNFDITNGTLHNVEYFINQDTCDYVVLELGINNTWDSLSPGFSTAWISDLQDARYLNKFCDIVVANGKTPIIVEIQPSYSKYYDSDTSRLDNMLSTIIRRNSMRKEFCASHGFLFVPTFDAFRLSNNKPNPTYYNSDMIHFNRAGLLLFGQLLASSSIPSSNKIYKNYKLKLQNNFTYTTTKKILYTVTLSNITDSIFWYNAKPSGSNLLLYVNDIKTRKNLREFDSYARKGILRFQFQGPVAKIELLDSKDTVDNNVLVFDSCNLLRLYPMDESKSHPVALVDIANNFNGVIADDRLETYYTAPYSIPNIICKNKYAYYNETTSLRASNSGLSGLSKFTISFWMWIYGNAWWTSKANILTSIGNSGSSTFRVFGASAFTINLGTTAITLNMPLSACTTSIKSGVWHRIVLSGDLSQSIQSDKFKIYVDTNDVSSNFTRSGTIGTALPTFTDSLNLLGWYTQSNFWPSGSAYRDYKITNEFTTLPEASIDYKLQTGEFTTVSVGVGSGGGSSRSAYKSAFKPAYK